MHQWPILENPKTDLYMTHFRESKKQTYTYMPLEKNIESEASLFGKGVYLGREDEKDSVIKNILK